MIEDVVRGWPKDAMGQKKAFNADKKVSLG
jgi:hypothetical protein